ncbi:MAG: TonB-dependent receptor [Hydrogenovibrio sp.]|uniref:TonB-dependent receptor domain-containing protein n=1 Tax=Hydrogenovibrio sp. TaxID=2065821 RepID=UPI00286FC990|nr:TonB-dependent receptor [Hydrogenovibrio sp.]MDR9498656.1 TonB-dependent receptor [Hydrogenovibrio sp.]
MQLKPLSFAILSTFAPASLVLAAEPTQLPPLTVETSAPQAAQTENRATADLLQNGNSESGDVLRQLNGVSATRKGGHGLDPQIRGQQYSQLNILMDGAKIAGGCPNRMDPPTSYSEIASYDEIEVIRGVTSVTHAAGGSGGTLLLKRQRPDFDPDKPVRGELNLGKSHLMNYDAHSELTAVGEKGYVVVQGAQKEANNYQDGNGDTVGASYQTRQGHIDLGWTPNEHHHLKLSAEQSRTEDAVYPGAMMDAPETEGNTLRLQYEGRDLNDSIRDMDVSVYRSTVDHTMNNFDLRTPPTMMGNPMLRETPTETETKGAKVQLTSNIAQTEIDYGVQFESVNKDATLFNRNNDTSLNHMWPDVTNTTKSVFAETTTDLTDTGQLIAGVRFDDVYADADKVNVAPDAAANQPSSVYGKAHTDYNGESNASESNWNGLLRFEQSFAETYQWYLGASRTMRTADATERFMSKWAGSDDSWVGNPNIKPEEHNQLDLGLGKATSTYSWNLGVWYDKVNNYILRDLAVNQHDNGVKTSLDGKSETYVNVDAQLYGLDLDGSIELTRQLKVGGQFSLTKGRNTSDSRDIAMISAPTGNVFAQYRQNDWHLGGRFNFALEQTDVDEDYTSSSFGETPAWSTLDLYGGMQINRTFSVQAGIDNVFDHAYYDHLSYDPVAADIYKNNEPGRNVWAKVNATF